MRTKAQKKEDITKLKKLLQGSGSLAFCDFTGTPTVAIQKLKRTLKPFGGSYTVTKKRLLGVAFKDAGITLDPKASFTGELGTVFAEGDVLTVASAIYKFSRELAKEKKEFKIVGGYDIAGKTFVTAEQFVALAKLPNRETLLSQFVGMLAAPIRSFMFVLNEMSKKAPAPATAATGGTQTVEHNN